MGCQLNENDSEKIAGMLEKMGYEHNDAVNYTVAACWEFIIPNVGADVANIGAPFSSKRTSVPKM